MKAMEEVDLSETTAVRPPVIQVRDLVKFYGDREVLKGVTFSVRYGETKVIIGESGSGKSTILKLIMRLERPDEGQILIDGEDITNFNEQQMVRIRKKLGMVFQESGLFDSLTVRENVAYRLYEAGVDDEDIEPLVLDTLRFVGLEEAIDKMPAELSGGMKRRVSLARALIQTPAIMLYDEPTAGLDPVTSKKINELIIRLRDIQRVSGVFVTHRLRDAFTLSTQYAEQAADGTVHFVVEDNSFCVANTKFLLFRDGRIVFDGPDDTLRRSEDPYIKKFLA